MKTRNVVILLLSILLLIACNSDEKPRLVVVIASVIVIVVVRGVVSCPPLPLISMVLRILVAWGVSGGMGPNVLYWPKDKYSSML